jgi:hypothetical protein
MLKAITKNSYSFAGAFLFKASRKIGPWIPRGSILVTYPHIQCAGEEAVMEDDAGGYVYFSNCPAELAPWAVRVVAVFSESKFFEIGRLQATRYRRGTKIDTASAPTCWSEVGKIRLCKPPVKEAGRQKDGT